MQKSIIMALLSSLTELETLFIDKLQEKYKLNKKDLKRAFSKFDKDNNGLLDLYELTKGIQLFLNGVKESQVQQLVQKYDKNGDGKISYDEFLYFLTTRSAITEGDDERSDAYSRPSSAGGYNPVGGGKLLRQAEAQRPRRVAPAAAYYDHDDDLERMTDDFDASEIDYPVYDDVKPRGKVAQVGRGRGAVLQNNYMNEDNNSNISQSNNKTNSKNIHNNNNNSSSQRHKAPINPYQDIGNSPRSEQPTHDGDLDYSHEYDDVQSRASTPYSEAPSALNPHNPRDIEYRVKIFMENLKTYLTKQAAAMRMNGQLSRQTAMMPAAEMRESVARGLLVKAFQPYTGQGEGKSRESFSGVELPEFAK